MILPMYIYFNNPKHDYESFHPTDPKQVVKKVKILFEYYKSHNLLYNPPIVKKGIDKQIREKFPAIHSDKNSPISERKIYRGFYLHNTIRPNTLSSPAIISYCQVGDYYQILAIDDMNYNKQGRAVNVYNNYGKSYPDLICIISDLNKRPQERLFNTRGKISSLKASASSICSIL